MPLRRLEWVAVPYVPAPRVRGRRGVTRTEPEPAIKAMAQQRDWLVRLMLPNRPSFFPHLPLTRDTRVTSAVARSAPAASCAPSSTTVYGIAPWVYEKYNQCATAKIVTWLDDGEIEAFIGAIATWGTPASWALLIVAWFLFIGQNFLRYAGSQGSPPNSGVYVAGTLAWHCVLIWCWTEYTPVYGWGNPPP